MCIAVYKRNEIAELYFFLNRSDVNPNIAQDFAVY